MIDWNKEVANVNYCGNCKNNNISICDESCFVKKENKIDHLSIEIEKAKQRIAALITEKQNLQGRGENFPIGSKVRVDSITKRSIVNIAKGIIILEATISYRDTVTDVYCVKEYNENFAGFQLRLL